MERYFSGFMDESFWPSCPSGFRCIVVKIGRKWVYGKEVSVHPSNFKRIRRSVWDNCLNKKRLPLTEIKKPKFLKEEEGDVKCR